jgi:tetratricopeptide (TPR) repeat protein
VGLKTARNTAASGRPDTRILARSWVESQVTPGSLFVLEHYTPNLDRKTYHTARIPMVSVTPEMSAPFYDLGWYADFDYLITSSAISDRYREDPDRFEKQARFYRRLKINWALAAEFPGDGTPGPTIQHSEIFVSKGWYAKAADIHKWLLRMDPDGSSRTLANLGKIAYKKGDLDAAIEIWEHVLRADSSSVDLYLNLGAAYYKKGAHNPALAIWERGYRTAPGDPKIAHNLALLYSDRNQNQRAATILNGALKTAPQDPRLHADLGDLCGARGDYEQAIRFYETALHLAPNREDFRNRLEELRKAQQQEGPP